MQSSEGNSTVREAETSQVFTWRLGYFFMRDVLAAGEWINVTKVTIGLSTGNAAHSVRLTNVSGTYKWQLWNDTTDTQVGSDSAAQTVGSTMLVNLRTDVAGDNLNLFIDGSSVISATPGTITVAGGLGGSVGDSDDAATSAAYWSAWCVYASASDDLNEAHYPELRLLHPEAGNGTHDGYTDGVGGGPNSGDGERWNDLVSEGDPDGDTAYNEGQDFTRVHTSTMTTHTMTNTIQGVAELILLRQDEAAKTVVHGGIIVVGSTDLVVSFGSEDIGESYVVREAVFHTEPSTGTWTQTLIDGMEGGHRRDAGSEALQLRVTAMGVVVVALGTTDLAPPDPPQSFPPISPLRAIKHLIVR